MITWFPTDSPRFFKLGVGECSEREMIFEILSFSSVGINVNYLLSELMFNNAELLQASGLISTLWNYFRLSAEIVYRSFVIRQ